MRTARRDDTNEVHLCMETHKSHAERPSLRHENTQSSVVCLDCKLKWTRVRQQITKLAKLLLLDICKDTGDSDGVTTKMSQLTVQLFLQLSLISLSLSLSLPFSLSVSLWGRYFCHTSSLNHRPARLCKFRKCLQSTHTHTHMIVNEQAYYPAQYTDRVCLIPS